MEGEYMGSELAVVEKKEIRLAEVKEFSNAQIKLLGDTIAKGCTPSEMDLFLEIAKLKRLDPFSGQVRPVKRWDSQLGREAMVVQTGIDGYRVIAARTGEHAGTDDAIYDSEETQVPIWAKVTVYRWSRGQRIPYTATARYQEYVQRKKPKDGQSQGDPNAMWFRMPYVMLGKCFSADTEILTSNGFERLDSVTGRVMQVGEDGVTATDALPFSQPYEGPMIEYSKDMLAFCVTPNHDMVTTLGKVEARAIYETATTRPVWFIPLTHEGVATDDQRFTDDQLRLAGYILADGSHNSHQRFVLAVSRPYKVEALKAMEANHEGVQHSRGAIAVAARRSVITNFDKLVFSFDASRVAGLIDQERTLNIETVLSLSPRQCKVLLNAWQLFDGHTNRKTGVRRIYTSRPDHVKAIEFVASRAGITVNCPRPRVSDLSAKINWSITLSSSAPQPIVRDGLGMVKNESGRVWCVTVPSGKVIVRRKGFALICGNCAESLALRKAFPDETAGLYTDEEMGQADNFLPEQKEQKTAVALPQPKKEAPKAEVKQDAVREVPPAEPENISGIIAQIKEGKEGLLSFTLRDDRTVVIAASKQPPDHKFDIGQEIFVTAVKKVIPQGTFWAVVTFDDVKSVVDGEILTIEDYREMPMTEDAEAIADAIFGKDDSDEDTSQGESTELPVKKGTIGVGRAKRLYTMRGSNAKNTGMTEADLKAIILNFPGKHEHLRDLPLDMERPVEDMLTGKIDFKQYL